MKTKEIAFLAVAVFFRVSAVSVALFGLFLVAAPMLTMGFGASLVFLRMLVAYLAAAAVLWFFSKPIASLVTNGLGDEPKP